MDRPRTLDELKDEIRRRAGKGRPFTRAKPPEIEEGLQKLTRNAPGTWARVWCELGERREAAGTDHEAGGRTAEAREAYLDACWYYQAARWPNNAAPPKRAAYDRIGPVYMKAARYFDVPVERVEIPFAGKPGEGDRIVGYFRRPAGNGRAPVAILSGGIDSTKEERQEAAEELLHRGLASLAVQMPGTGDSPILASTEGHRQYQAILDWIAIRPDLDANSVGMIGSSFGGYWATALAHREPTRLHWAVNWGGGVHRFFQPEWNEKSRYADSYLFELLETRAAAIGLETAEEYIEAAPSLSLLTQRLLDEPASPMFLTDGKYDQQVPIEDFYLLLEHGSPKSIRVFPGGHMGEGPVQETVPDWVVKRR